MKKWFCQIFVFDQNCHPKSNTGTNNASLSVSRNGDCGKRLAAGIILPPFCVYARRVAAVAVVVGAVVKSSEKALVKRFGEKLYRILSDLKYGRLGCLNYWVRLHLYLMIVSPS